MSVGRGEVPYAASPGPNAKAYPLPVRQEHQRYPPCAIKPYWNEAEKVTFTFHFGRVKHAYPPFGLPFAGDQAGRLGDALRQTFTIFMRPSILPRYSYIDIWFTSCRPSAMPSGNAPEFTRARARCAEAAPSGTRCHQSSRSRRRCRHRNK